MKRALFLTVLAVALAAGALPAAAVPVAAPAADLAGGNISGIARLPLGGEFPTSQNVYYLGTLLTESPGVGGRFLVVNGQPRFYMTGAKGLSIYDVSRPTAPVLLGHLPLAHFQNEDVDVSDDGSRVIVGIDTVGLSPTPSPQTPRFGTGVYVIDITEVVPGRVLRPQVAGFIGEGNHTATCADPACEYIYGSERDIIRVQGRGPGATLTKVGELPAGTHAYNRDAAGFLVSDGEPRLVLDPRPDPANPRIVARGPVTDVQGYLEHNNVRPAADAYVPRDPQDPADAYTDGSFEGTSALRPGELLIGNAESNINPRCADAGGLSTWDMRDWDRGRDMRQIAGFQPANGTLALDGRPPVNALGCSGHWFTAKDGLIAASWYEHGVRFIEVDETNGQMQEVGYFQPVATEAGASHFVGTVTVPGLNRTLDVVYNVDYARGIDIIAFDRGGPVPSNDELAAAWLANLDRSGTGVFANVERALCRAAREEAARA